MSDWFDGNISRYRDVIFGRKAPERTEFMTKFDRTYERFIQPQFLWFAYKAHLHGLESGHCVSEWRPGGHRTGTVWLKIQATVYQLNVTGRRDEEDIRYGSAVFGHAPELLAASCEELEEETVRVALERFLLAALESERESSN